MLNGMDISRVRSLAHEMLRGATDLRGLVRDLTVAVEHAPWRGPDRDRFVDKWNSHHMVRLNRTAAELEDACDEATDYARRQEEVSRR